ncbi:MAG: hypothetical protein L0Y58_08155, partial [Verrucomicrobia subdivision 3 bacterium]|nr:hypothetical protein [Limisphaerales bacterium]
KNAKMSAAELPGVPGFARMNHHPQAMPEASSKARAVCNHRREDVADFSFAQVLCAVSAISARSGIFAPSGGTVIVVAQVGQAICRPIHMLSASRR